MWKGARDTQVSSPTYIQEILSHTRRTAVHTWKIPYWILRSRLTRAAAWQLLRVRTGHPVAFAQGDWALVFADHLYFPESGDSSRRNAREGPSYAGLQVLRVDGIGMGEYIPAP